MRAIIEVRRRAMGGATVFDETLLESSSRRLEGRKRVTVPLAIALEALIAAGLTAVPLMRIAALPEPDREMSAIRVPSAPPASATRSTVARNRVHRVTLADLWKEPIEIPRIVSRAAEPALPPAPVAINSGAGGTPGGLGTGGLGLPGYGMPVPPPRQTPASQKPLRVGGDVQAARLIYGPKPAYPALARMARVQGTVRLEAIIAKDGTIQALRAVSGNPLLTPAALETVAQWRYRPTTLNGEAMEVETEIDIVFTLGD